MKPLRLSLLALAASLAASLTAALTPLSAQTNTDAYRLTNESFTGTARYQALGGAMGALGGDISSIKQNPAGLGVLRHSEVQFSYEFMFDSYQADWYNNRTSTGYASQAKNLGMSHISLSLYFPPSGKSGKTSWSLAFAKSPRHSFNRDFRISAGGSTPYSLADYAAAITPNQLTEDDLEETYNFNPYSDTPAPWLAILGYNAGWTSPTGAGYYENAFLYNEDGKAIIGYPFDTNLHIKEYGQTDDYAFNFGLNWDDRAYFGMGLNFSSILYKMESDYQETFTETDNLWLHNGLVSRGSATSLSLGAIVRLSDYFRLGASYFSPMWTTITDTYYAEAGSHYEGIYDADGNLVNPEIAAATPTDAATRYGLTGPSKFVFSAAAILGRYGLISADLELTNHSGMGFNRVSDIYDYSNSILHEYYRPVTLGVKVGAEGRVTNQLSLRAGFNYRQSPVRGELTPVANQTPVVVIEEAGTVPHYDLEGAYTNYTCGLGYRFTPAFYADVAMVFGSRHYSFYPFSTLVDATGGVVVESTEPIRLTDKQINATFTLGYRF